MNRNDVEMYIYLAGLALAIIYLLVRFMIIISNKYKHHDNVSFISAVYALTLTYILIPIIYIKAFFQFNDTIIMAKISTDILHFLFLLMLHSLIINFPRTLDKVFTKYIIYIFIPSFGVSLYNLLFTKTPSFILNVLLSVYLMCVSILLSVKLKNVQ